MRRKFKRHKCNGNYIQVHEISLSETGLNRKFFNIHISTHQVSLFLSHTASITLIFRLSFQDG